MVNVGGKTRRCFLLLSEEFFPFSSLFFVSDQAWGISPRRILFLSLHRQFFYVKWTHTNEKAPQDIETITWHWTTNESSLTHKKANGKYSIQNTRNNTLDFFYSNWNKLFSVVWNYCHGHLVFSSGLAESSFIKSSCRFHLKFGNEWMRQCNLRILTFFSYQSTHNTVLYQ